MDVLRISLAAATGAVIGVVVVIALAWSIRILGPRRASAGAAPDVSSDSAGPRRFGLSLLAKIAIVALATAAYGYLGYINRPAPPDTPPPDAAPAQSAFAAPTPPAQFNVGGVTLSFTPPSGYCLYPPSLMQAIVAQQGKINPDNVVHTVFGNCDQLREAAATQIRIRDFGMLMTPKGQISQDFDPPALERVIASAAAPGNVKETLDQRLRAAQTRLKLQSWSSLGILDRDRSAAYFAYLFKSETQGESFAQACIMALTTSKGRLISYYLYADYTKDARNTLLGLLQKVKASLGDLGAQND